MSDGRAALLKPNFLDHAVAFLGLWHKYDSRAHKIIPFHPGGDNSIAYASEKALTSSALDAQIRAEFCTFADGASGLHWLAYHDIIAHGLRFNDVLIPRCARDGYEVLPAARALLRRIPDAAVRYDPFVCAVVTDVLAKKQVL